MSNTPRTYEKTELPVHELDALIAVPGILKLEASMRHKFAELLKGPRVKYNGSWVGIPDEELPGFAEEVGVDVAKIREGLQKAYNNNAEWEEALIGGF